jgi:hypothetical protein
MIGKSGGGVRKAYVVSSSMMQARAILASREALGFDVIG